MNESTVATSQGALGETATVLSIRDSKGFEFDHVMIVDLFSDLEPQHRGGWKNMNNGNEVTMQELELQIKQLYTAITQCCKRCLMVETNKQAHFSRNLAQMGN